jgi:hypothetical protein
VFVATIEAPTPTALGDTSSDQLAWREDGQLVGLGRSGREGTLSIQLLSSSASAAAQPVLDVPLKPSRQYAAIWDVPRARLVIANEGATGEIDYWLAGLGLEDGA